MHLFNQHQMPGYRTWGGVLAAWAMCCLPSPVLTKGAEEKPMNTPAIQKDRFGTTADGAAIDRYTLRNAHGMTVRLINYGATVTELMTPDRNGKLADVALGFDNLAQYETESPYFGCTAGRVAFRITAGKFTLDGKPYSLTINAAPHHLHGGTKGLSKVVWHAEPLEGAAAPAVKFTHRSPDGDQGYPGNLDVTVVYTLTGENELKIEYTAVTDRPTPVNLTHHTYFNLNGAGRGTILDHVLQIPASRYPLLDGKGIPSGRIATVAGTPLDFRVPTAIGQRLQPGSEVAGGYDAAYLVDRPGPGPVLMATLTAPASGRRLDVLSTEPALVLYTGNYLDGTLHGKQHAVYGKHAGVCLETAHLPDSVNRPEFPPIILRPGETYRQTCIYRFSAHKG
jgi:aldose 1-epimerase